MASIEGRKDDQGKARYDLLPPEALDDLVQVYTQGAVKYAARNWEKGIKWGRIFGAIMRHLWAFWRGEDHDPESGLPHPAHAAWGCLALLQFMRTHRNLDDRPARQGHLAHPSVDVAQGPEEKDISL
jgi:hypothetical protein